jgi:hypothetical protein
VGAGSLGVGVALRLPPHGLIDSTADVKYDFSGFLSGGAEDILSTGPGGHPNRFTGRTQTRKLVEASLRCAKRKSEARFAANVGANLLLELDSTSRLPPSTKGCLD